MERLNPSSSLEAAKRAQSCLAVYLHARLTLPCTCHPLMCADWAAALAAVAVDGDPAKAAYGEQPEQQGSAPRPSWWRRLPLLRRVGSREAAAQQPSSGGGDGGLELAAASAAAAAEAGAATAPQAQLQPAGDAGSSAASLGDASISSRPSLSSTATTSRRSTGPPQPRALSVRRRSSSDVGGAGPSPRMQRASTGTQLAQRREQQLADLQLSPRQAASRSRRRPVPIYDAEVVVGAPPADGEEGSPSWR